MMVNTGKETHLQNLLMFPILRKTVKSSFKGTLCVVVSLVDCSIVELLWVINDYTAASVNCLEETAIKALMR